MIGRNFRSRHEINPDGQQQRFELLHHHMAWCSKILVECSREYILPNLSLKSSISSFCLDHRLNSLWHALNQIIPLMMLKVISNTNNHLPHNLQRCNMSIFLRNYMLYMRPNVLNWIEIRRVWRVLMALHSQLLSNRNADLLVRRSIVFHNYWLFQVLE